MRIHSRRWIDLALFWSSAFVFASFAYAAPSKVVPGFQFLKWGMTINEFETAVKGKQGYKTTRPSDCGGPSTDKWAEDTFACARRFDAPPINIAGYRVEAGLVTFLFKGANGRFVLSGYSATHTMKTFTDISTIEQQLGKLYPKIPVDRPQSESMHFAWDAGNSEIHLGQDMIVMKYGGSAANGIWFRVHSKQ